MKHPTILTLGVCAFFLPSCGLIDGILQPTKRLIQSGVRTLGDAGETNTPAPREGAREFAIATEKTE